MINNYNRHNYNLEIPNYPNKYKIPYKRQHFNYIFKSKKKSEYLIKPTELPNQISHCITWQEYKDIFTQCEKQILKRQFSIRLFFYSAIFSLFAFIVPFVLVLTLTHASNAMVLVPIGLFIEQIALVVIFSRRRYSLEIQFNQLIKDLNAKYSHKGITIYKKLKYFSKQADDRYFETHRDFVNRIYIYYGFPQQEQSNQIQTPSQAPQMYQITSSSPSNQGSINNVDENTPLLSK